MAVQVAGGTSSGRMKPVLRGMKHASSWRRGDSDYGYVVFGFMMELYKSASIGRTADRGAEFKANAHSPRIISSSANAVSPHYTQHQHALAFHLIFPNIAHILP